MKTDSAMIAYLVVGLILLAVLLEYAPRVGGGVALLIVTYLVFRGLSHAQSNPLNG